MTRTTSAVLLTAVLLPTAVCAGVAAAQPPTGRDRSAAESELCDRAAAPTRYPDAAARVRTLAGQGGAAGEFAQGCLALAAGDYDKATGAFERAVAADPSRAPYHYFLGRAYGARAQQAGIFGRVSLAKKTRGEFERAVALDPEYLDAHEGLMVYYLVAPGIVGGSKDKARGEAEEIRRRDPYRGGLAMTQIAVRQKDYAGAQRELDAMTRQYPDSAGPYATLATLYGQQKRWPDAWATVERLVRAQPDAPVAIYALGRLAQESGQQLDRGAAAFARYLQATPRPGDPPLANAHWRLGLIYEQQAKKDPARAEFEAALRLDPKLAGAREGLERTK